MSGKFRDTFSFLGRRASQSRLLCAGIFAVCGLIAALSLFLICFWVRLQFGPIMLGPSVSMVSGALDDALPEGILVSYGQAALEWSREDDRVHLAIFDIRMADSEGKPIISAPKAEIDLAGAPLLRGAAEVHRITLVGVKVTLVRTAEGTLRFGIGKNRIDQDIIDQFVHKLSSAKGGSSLKTLAVHNAKLTFYDEPSDLYITSGKADLHLARTSVSKDLQVVLDMELSVAGRRAQVHVFAGYPLTATKCDGVADIRGLDIAAFLAHRKSSLLSRDSHLLTNARIAFSLAHGALKSTQFTLSGKGALTVPALQQTFPVRRLALSGTYDGGNATLHLQNAMLDADGASGQMSGQVQMATAGTGAEHASFTVQNLALRIPRLFADPVRFSTIGLDADWDGGAQRLSLTRLHADSAPLRLEASGAVQFSDKGSPGLDLTGSLGMLDVRNFVKFWPVGAAPGGRVWVDANMSAGEVGPFSFDIHLKPGDLDAPELPSDSVDVRFLMSNVESAYMPGMPHLTGMNGHAHLTGTDFTIDVDRASNGPMTVTRGRFHIPDINAASQIGEISFSLSGTVPDLMTLLDSPPLGYPSRFGIRPNATSGKVLADARLSVPLIQDVPVSKIQISVHSETTGLGVRLASHLNVTGGDIIFDVDNSKLHAAGAAGMGGSAGRLDLDWTELFSAPKGQPTTHLTFSGTLDEAARQSLGTIPAAMQVKGPVRATGMFEGFRGAMADGHISVDLTPASVTYAPLNIHKAAGQNLQADVTLGFRAKSALSQVSIAFSGNKGQSGHAVLSFDPQGGLQRVELPDFRYGRDNQFSLQLHRKGALDAITLTGAAVDFSGLLENKVEAGHSSPDSVASSPAVKRGYQIHVAVDQARLRDGVKLSRLKLDFGSVGERIRAFSLDGMLGKSALHGTMTQNDAGRVLKISCADAGLLFRGVYGLASMRGGTLDATVQLPGPATLPSSGKPSGNTAAEFTGKLAMENFRIINQPLLTRLFSAGSLGGMANLMAGNGIVVDRFNSSFTARNHVVSVFETHATGPSIGVTAEGYVDLGKDVVALKGTLVPLYGLNSVLGNIPLLGQVLTSKKGEGIFGVSYEISGNTAEPSVSVYPLSVLAPGFLRRIFEGRIPKASEAPSNNPSPAKKKTKSVPQNKTSGGAAAQEKTPKASVP